MKNKYWAGRQVMRALLPGSRGHVVGLKRYNVQQVTDRWGDLSETAGAGLPCWSHALSEQESDTEHICLSISDITCVFPSKSVSYPWSSMEEVDDICSRSHREEVTLSRKRRGTSFTLQFWRCSFNNWINCVILHIKSPAQLSVSLRDLHTWVPPPLPWKSNKGPIAECWLSGGNKCLVVECFNIMAWLCSSGSDWIIWMWEITKYKNPHVMLLFLNYKIQQTGREETGNQKVGKFELNSPLKTTLELWLSQQGLCPNALVIILLLTVFGANSGDIHERKTVDTKWSNCWSKETTGTPGRVMKISMLL